MAKGFFTQGAVVLFEKHVSIERISSALKEFKIVKTAKASENWEFGGPSAIIEFLPEVNGYISVDTVNQKWPDQMGDPKDEPTLFSCWSMGHFGPFAYPSGLERACQQSWRWEEAIHVVEKHNAFTRIRISYIFGCDDNAPVVPEGYDPLGELEQLLNVSVALLDVDDAICYFNPNGEVLANSLLMEELLGFCHQHDQPPFDLISNIRLFNIAEDWLLMDSVGNWQLDMPDHEVGFPKVDYDPDEVDNFIRNASLYILNNGEIIKDGDTMDGPGNIRWQAKMIEKGLSDPPRNILRWLPTGIKNIPVMLVGDK